MTPSRRPGRPHRARPIARALLFGCVVFVAGARPALHAAPPDDPDYRASYSKGITFADFLDKARTRPDEWRKRYNDATVTPDLVTRMRALPERRLILAVAEDWCSDSANTIPYVARLVDGAPERLALRIVNSKAGRAVMDANLTPDGRAATPTIVILREDGTVVGAWVERPSTAQTWFLEQKKTVAHDPLHEQLRKWYAEDAGRTTMAEIAALLER
jgi:Thioredoxin